MFLGERLRALSEKDPGRASTALAGGITLVIALLWLPISAYVLRSAIAGECSATVCATVQARLWLGGGNAVAALAGTAALFAGLRAALLPARSGHAKLPSVIAAMVAFVAIALVWVFTAVQWAASISS